ncbi:uncharacterized protein UV8b_06069 [Ustilaginoidea virens]|uniref:Uncharacterized protein n=1 Tax=Ustilaginoidea virens TaxID=1159556 RepID=A0A8E5MIR0_USTVR|nr:uncharacterized protein UV8b_06069 [Ustilaginoidea virens]QUC21828.1 hypothetical protein UV8b_06069 [Ustilaginoidea virens]
MCVFSITPVFLPGLINGTPRLMTALDVRYAALQWKLLVRRLGARDWLAVGKVSRGHRRANEQPRPHLDALWDQLPFGASSHKAGLRLRTTRGQSWLAMWTPEADAAQRLV